MFYSISLKFEVISGAAAVSSTWPATLPQKVLHREFKITPVANTVRTKVESGPVFQRPRYSVQMDMVEAIIITSSTQLATFWTFWHTTLGGGSLRFNWKHPITGSDCICQFNGEETPEVNSI